MEARNLLPRSAVIKARALVMQENLATLEIAVNKIQAHKQAHKIMANKAPVSKLQGPAIAAVLKAAIPQVAAVQQAVRAMATILSVIYRQGAAR